VRNKRIALLKLFGGVLAGLSILLITATTAHAANPTTISFQGKVVNSNGTNVADGTYSFVFKLYSVASGGTAVWSETDSLAVTAGTFQVNLGATCSFFTAAICNNNTPIDFNASNALYLGITFNSDPAGEMTPRAQLQSVPYAFNADKVGGLSASQLAQLSPTSQQTGNINVNGTGTFANGLTVGTSSVITNADVLQNVTANTSILTSGTLGVARGGTGLATLTANGLLYASSASAVGQLSGTSGQVLIANASGVPAFDTISGNATVDPTGVLTIASGAVSNADLTSSQVTVTAGTNLTGGGAVALGSAVTLNVTPTPVFTSQTDQSSTYTTSQFLLNDGQTTAPPAFPNSVTPALTVVTSEQNGSRPLFFGYDNAAGTGYDATLNSGACGSFTQMCLDLGSGTTYSTALENTGTTLDVGGGADGNFTNIDLAASGGVGVGTATPSSLFSVGASSQFQVNTTGAVTAVGVNSGAGLLQGTAGATVTGAAVNLNASSNFATNINTGTSTGAVSIGGGNAPLAIDSTAFDVSTAGALSGITTINASGEATLSGSGATELALTGTPSATATASLIQAATAITGGSTSGTYIGINQASGASADFLNFQLAGVSELKVTSAGALTATTSVTTKTVNATTSYEANGTAGATFSCGANTYVNTAVVSEGIITGHSACTTPPGISDERLKTNIVPINGSDVLSDLEAVNPVTFDFDCSNDWFNENNITCNTESQAGVLAQQLMKIFPNLVNADEPDGYYSVNYQGLDIYTLEGVAQLARHLDASGNANLNAVSANNITTNNLTVNGTLTYSSLASPNGNFSDSVTTPTVTSTAGLSIDSGGANDVSIDAGAPGGNINIGNTNANSVSVSSAGHTTTINGGLSVDQDSSFSGNVASNLSNGDNITINSDLSGNNDVININATPSATAGTKNGINISQSASTNTNGLSSALSIDNANSTTAIGSAITITNSGGGGYTNIINTPNFSVSGAGDVSTDGVISDKGGSIQLTNDSGNQVFSVDSSGNATFGGNLNLASASLSGGLNVAGDLNVAGLSTFQKMATFVAKTVFQQNVDFQGHVTLSGDSAGYAQLTTGQDTVHVTFKTPYDAAPIITANITNGQFNTLSVNNVTVNGFDITTATPVVGNTTINWTALGVDNPVTATSTETPVVSTPAATTPTATAPETTSSK
jgi:hypothetical protein